MDTSIWHFRSKHTRFNCRVCFWFQPLPESQHQPLLKRIHKIESTLFMEDSYDLPFLCFWGFFNYRPHPKDDGKVLFSVCQSTPGGVPHPYPSPSLSIPVGGGTWSSLGQGGIPQSSLGWGGGVPQPWMGGYPNLGLGGTPTLDRGVPHLMSGGGTPGTPLRIASTCYGYAAGGVPLAFTQEDFLVVISISNFAH